MEMSFLKEEGAILNVVGEAITTGGVALGTWAGTVNVSITTIRPIVG
jgi:hypothetical protein